MFDVDPDPELDNMTRDSCHAKPWYRVVLGLGDETLFCSKSQVYETFHLSFVLLKGSTFQKWSWWKTSTSFYNNSPFSITLVVSQCLVLVCDCVWIRLDHENTGGEPGLESVGSKEVCPGPVERDQWASLSCGVTGDSGPLQNQEETRRWGYFVWIVCL